MSGQVQRTYKEPATTYSGNSGQLHSLEIYTHTHTRAQTHVYKTCTLCLYVVYTYQNDIDRNEYTHALIRDCFIRKYNTKTIEGAGKSN